MLKRSTKRDRLHLLNIRDSIEKIEKYIKLGSREKFLNDELTFDAVVMQFCVIGIHLKNLSDSFIRKNSQIPYKKIIGMRNIISHSYHKVDKSLVWKTCQDDLPLLKEIIEEVLQKN